MAPAAKSEGTGSSDQHSYFSYIQQVGAGERLSFLVNISSTVIVLTSLDSSAPPDLTPESAWLLLVVIESTRAVINAKPARRGFTVPHHQTVPEYSARAMMWRMSVAVNINHALQAHGELYSFSGWGWGLCWIAHLLPLGPTAASEIDSYLPVTCGMVWVKLVRRRQDSWESSISRNNNPPRHQILKISAQRQHIKRCRHPVPAPSLPIFTTSPRRVQRLGYMNYSHFSNSVDAGGGTGGQGGSSPRKGGAGGLGECPQISISDAQLFHQVRLTGGIGGRGGEGLIEGGIGGVGQGARFSKKLVVIEEKALLRVPHLTISGFCRQFQLSDKIFGLLEEEGFETAGALLQVEDMTLRTRGFKEGQIAEVQRALTAFVAQPKRGQVSGQR
ncbi:hypothetical protein DFH08DRAFT_991714 [Mycena albidolilacea]|uniref:SAM domain-containing protein n=1 Tax=Mycena albidolilacea TaxID=1033008 RepID=A0AAD7EWE1_9AGAR|nr:hypothetical protein DFH08DRAFT_991714 [Mycena albidolilacea]